MSYEKLEMIWAHRTDHGGRADREAVTVTEPAQPLPIDEGVLPGSVVKSTPKQLD